MDAYGNHISRLRKRMVDIGVERLEDYQLLELVLGSSDNLTAHKLLDRFGDFSGILRASVDQLMCIDGISPTHIAVIRAVQIIANTEIAEPIAEPVIMSNSHSVGEFISRAFVNEDEESAYMICFNSGGELIDVRKVAKGDLTSSLVDMRKLIELALECNASAIAIAHNHPSGFAVPSPADVETTLAIKAAMDFANITLVDHIIVSKTGWVSMLESRLI